MPGMEPEEWLNPLGILSLILESIFIVLAIPALPSIQKRKRQTFS
jgi:hypothetical protein